MQMVRRLIVICFAMTVASFPIHGSAQDARSDLVERIARAQGLVEIFDQQLAQQREATKAYALRMFNQAVEQAGGQANPKEQAAFERFVARTTEIFKSEEVVAAWTRHYGRNLSIQDLEDVLRYYESPVGQKDVAANKAAMPAFAAWMNQEAQGRSTALITDFVAELKAARQ